MDVEKQNAPPQPQPNEPPPAYTTNYGGTDTAPPTYNQTVGPPPSYESVFGQLQETRRQSSSLAEFFKKLIILVLGTLGCTICVGMIMAIPVSMMTIGSYFVHQCRIERYIPIYLIVGGVFGVIKNIINIGQRIKHHREDQQDENAKTNPVDALLNCFLLAWFIAGNVWIYRVYGEVCYDDPLSSCYCHPTLYLFAFWITTSMYILISTLCCCICCAGICASATTDNK